MEKFYKPSEAAKFLGISKRTIKYMKKDGRIVPDKVDDTKHIFYSESQLLKIKNGANDIAKNSAGDTQKMVQNYKNGAKTVQSCAKNCITERKIGVTAPFVENELVDENQENLSKIGTIPLQTVQNRVKNGDIECKNGVTAPLTEPAQDEKSDTSTAVVSVNIIPTTKLTVPNDKFCKKFFNLSQESYTYILENGGAIEECEKPKVGKIYSEYEVALINNYTSTVPLDMFDKAVLTACDSEFIAGNRFTTPAIIYRHMIGKDNGSNIEPPHEIREAILNSVRKMMCTQITYDMTTACKHLKYNNGNSFRTTAPALPCKCVSGISINGQEFESVIQLYDASPFLNIARVKNKQLLTFEKKLLDVPKQRNVTATISVKHYIIQRVLEIKLHNMTSTIIFDDVFKKCNLADANRLKKSRVRSEIIEIMTFLQSVGDILSFNVKKVGNKYHCIEFSFAGTDSGKNFKKKSNGGYEADRQNKKWRSYAVK